jgi:hypothetical protein
VIRDIAMNAGERFAGDALSAASLKDRRAGARTPIRPPFGENRAAGFGIERVAHPPPSVIWVWPEGCLNQRRDVAAE